MFFYAANIGAHIFLNAMKIEGNVAQGAAKSKSE
jgi:hypothetical protein